LELILIIKMVKRKVTCVFGKFDDKSDFILEPACPDELNCECCKNAFWIEEIRGGLER